MSSQGAALKILSDSTLVLETTNGDHNSEVLTGVAIEKIEKKIEKKI